jgi:hypothetical protein
MSLRTTPKHRLLLGLTAISMLIALTALPGYSAPQKTYTLNVAPSEALAGQSTGFFVTMTNKTPGNSNPNSFLVRAPSGFTVTAASISAATNPNAGASVTVVGSSTVEVRNLDPVKTNQYVTLKITATTPSIGGSCSQGGYIWSATVWTGSNLSGDTFTLNNPGAAQETTLVSCLELRFVPGFAPTDGTIDTDIPVKAAVYVAGGSTPVSSFTGDVTIEFVSGPAGALLSGNGPTAAVAGVANFPNFRGDTTGDYEVKATATGVAGSDLASFTLYAGILDCGEAVTIGAEGAEVTLTRLEGTTDGTNPDGSTCLKVLYTLTRGDNVVEFLKDLTQQPTAEFTIEVTSWDPEPAVNPVPPTQVEPPSPAHDVDWCEGTATPFAPVPPGDEVWCLVSQSTTIVGPDPNDLQTQLMQVSETFYGKGDPKLFR